MTEAKTRGRFPIRVAHRAGNSVAGIRTALEVGVDWIELDLWWQHGQLVARHDRTLWPLPVRYDKWYVQLYLQPLILEEICRLSNRGVQLLLDLKGSAPRLPKDLVETLRRHDALNRVTLCGQNWSLLDATTELEPGLPALYSLETAKQLAALRDRIRRPPSLFGVSCQEQLLTQEVVTWMRGQKLLVFAWTVNDIARAERLITYGVDGIISDRLDLLVSLADPTDGR
jgi:glycerophosphoryl diester phosphodiesterase